MATIMIHTNLSSAQTNISFVPTARVDLSSLAGEISDPIIQSFDLSPDGKTVALLVVAGSKVGAPLSLVTEDVAAKHVTASSELGAAVFPMGGFTPQVVYSSDGRYLVVQDLRSVRVKDSSSLRTIRTIAPPPGKELKSPLFVIGASSRNVFACAFGGEQKFNPRLQATPVQVEVVDISSGESLGNWASEDVPQALSPNGDLVAVSSSQPQQGVLPLNVFGTHGQKVAALTGGFSFRNAGQSKALGRVMGIFVGAQELLLTPDDNTDQSGHHSGDSLQLVTFTGRETQVQGSIKPRHYGPTGELAISADSKTALAISWYVPARSLAHEGALPASTPELVVLGMGARGHVEASLPIHPFGLKVAGWLENRRPRISSDGSVIAVAQDSGVTVLTKNPISAQHP
jgi:hypothetical protein